MRPVTLGNSPPPEDRGFLQWVQSALQEIQRASQDTLKDDQSSSGNAIATVFGAAADEIAYFTSEVTTAFTALTAFGRSLIGAADGLALLALLPEPGLLWGLTLAIDGGDPTNDIAIAVGHAADSGNLVTMTLLSNLTKRLDAAWAVGTGNGGLDTGSVANGLYHVFLIKRTDTGVVDALFSTSATAPTMPSGYTLKRRLGSFYRVAAANALFVQAGDRFTYVTGVLDYNTATLGAARALVTLSCPPNTVARFRAYEYAASAAGVIIQPTIEADAAPSFAGVPGLSLYSPAAFATIGEFEVAVDGSSQIAVRSDTANTNMQIVTKGWSDTRGRLA